MKKNDSNTWMWSVLYSVNEFRKFFWEFFDVSPKVMSEDAAEMLNSNRGKELIRETEEQAESAAHAC